MQKQIYPFCQIFKTGSNCGVYGVLYRNPNFERDFDCNLFRFDPWNFASWCRQMWRGVCRRKTQTCKFGVYRVLHWSPSFALSVTRPACEMNSLYDKTCKHMRLCVTQDIHLQIQGSQMRTQNWNASATIMEKRHPALPNYRPFPTFIAHFASPKLKYEDTFLLLTFSTIDKDNRSCPKLQETGQFLISAQSWILQTMGGKRWKR